MRHAGQCSRATRRNAEPMNPAPPVTNKVFILCKQGILSGKDNPSGLLAKVAGAGCPFRPIVYFSAQSKRAAVHGDLIGLFELIPGWPIGRKNQAFAWQIQTRNIPRNWSDEKGH